MSLEAVYRKAPPALQTLFLNGYAVKIATHRYGPRYRAAVRRLMESERWPRERMANWQDERLRDLVQFAWDQSPYYRKVLQESGLAPGDFRGAGDLPQLPLLTKDQLREELPRILTARKPGPGWLHGHTSGTTGAPLSLWYDRETAVLTNAVDRRQKVWGGMRDGDWIGILLGRTIVPVGQSGPPFWRTNLVLRQVWYSTLHLGDEKLPAYVAHIRRRRLRFLEGYPSSLFILARHVLESGATLPMQAVFTSSETLHDAQRHAIEAAFQCRIYDFYGHAERVAFAAECGEPGGKHLAEEFGVTEIVDATGKPVEPGAIGYLVGTSLVNRAMPMLRYRTGDLTRLIEEPCPCGRTSRRIADVSTKAEDIILTPEGRLIPPSILTHPFKPYPQIRKSQIVQDTLDSVHVKVVPGEDYTEQVGAELLAALRERLGPGIDVRISLVPDIPREASGKFRWIISRVDHRAHLSWD